MKRFLIAASLGFFCSGASLAQPEMRAGVPAVIEPSAPPFPDADAISGDFRQAYLAAKKPRIVVLWNRALSDVLTTSHDTEAKLSNRIVGARVPGAAAIQQDVSVSTQVKRGEEPMRKSGLSEREEWGLEAAFDQPLLASGAVLVDRATSMRISEKGQAATETSNLQAIETAALQAKANLLVEILITRDPDAETGTAFQVAIKDLSTGTLSQRFVTTAIPESAKRPRYYANERGFAAVPVAPTADEVGKQLGLETMAALTAHLKRVR